ncbi:MAG: NAD(P)-dependent oxidoreductase [Hoeflea sp.]|nr:NAD(P)-dependent oxidoreductase [Hoeflea sp.]MDP2119597.1 NAD(P)-dependent oxidoreductase [Hoeflea sp.]
MADHSRTVGLLGIGLVGRAVVPLLQKAGFEVVGYAPSQASRDALRDLGGRPVDSVADVARACGIVVLAVFNSDQVEQVVEAENGLLSVAPPEGLPRIIVNTSTCEPDRMVALDARIADSAVFVEMPISGTSTQIARGEGVGLIGGREADIDRAENVLAAICPRRFTLGSIGSGGKAKLAVNLVLGLNRAAIAEGIVFAEKLGIDPRAFLDVARNSAAYSQVMDVKGPKMVERDYLPLSKVSQTLKDFTIMRDYGEAAGQRLPFAETYIDMMEGCIRAGEGEWDNAAILEEIKRRRTGSA